MANVIPFHAHLDECERCRTKPFDLCEKGAVLLVESAQASSPSCRHGFASYNGECDDPQCALALTKELAAVRTELASLKLSVKKFVCACVPPNEKCFDCLDKHHTHESIKLFAELERVKAASAVWMKQETDQQDRAEAAEKERDESKARAEALEKVYEEAKNVTEWCEHSTLFDLVNDVMSHPKQ